MQKFNSCERQFQPQTSHARIRQRLATCWSSLSMMWKYRFTGPLLDLGLPRFQNIGPFREYLRTCYRNRSPDRKGKIWKCVVSVSSGTFSKFKLEVSNCIQCSVSYGFDFSLIVHDSACCVYALGQWSCSEIADRGYWLGEVSLVDSEQITITRKGELKRKQ